MLRRDCLGRYGISVPNFGSYGDVRALAELAHDADVAGWDGFFIWDHMIGDEAFGPTRIDPWIALAAIAMRTERLRIGTMITPLPRRRPWKLARETVTLDHLSGGRVTLGVGLGYPPEEYSTFGEDADDRVRAEKLDEGLAVLAGLWSGKPFAFEGTHFHVSETTFLPAPLQSPRIPVWVAGIWPSRRPLRRAARWDGVFPIKEGGMSPLSTEEVARIIAYVREHRTGGDPFDVVLSGESEGDGPVALKETLADYAAAGATWWLESLTDWRGTLSEMRDYVRNGPPR